MLEAAAEKEFAEEAGVELSAGVSIVAGGATVAAIDAAAAAEAADATDEAAVDSAEAADGGAASKGAGEADEYGAGEDKQPLGIPRLSSSCCFEIEHSEFLIILKQIDAKLKLQFLSLINFVSFSVW